jgi:hypothetical protein
LNLNSIAKVCDTDCNSIELILKEIVAQVRHQIKIGNNVRLMMKVGTFIVKGGDINWKSINNNED